MHQINTFVRYAGVVAVALALAGCANLPVQNYADAAPAGYYSPDYGYYVPDDYYWSGWWHHHSPSAPAHFDRGAFVWPMMTTSAGLPGTKASTGMEALGNSLGGTADSVADTGEEVTVAGKCPASANTKRTKSFQSV